jgi:hypothetical protein
MKKLSLYLFVFLLLPFQLSFGEEDTTLVKDCSYEETGDGWSWWQGAWTTRDCDSCDFINWNVFRDCDHWNINEKHYRVCVTEEPDTSWADSGWVILDFVISPRDTTVTYYINRIANTLDTVRVADTVRLYQCFSYLGGIIEWREPEITYRDSTVWVCDTAWITAGFIKMDNFHLRESSDTSLMYRNGHKVIDTFTYHWVQQYQCDIVCRDSVVVRRK